MALSKKTKTVLIVGGITLAVLMISWMIFKKVKSGKTNKQIATQAAATESCLTFPIAKGAGYTKTCESAAVLLIQRWINNNSDWSMPVIDEDGKFGSETEDSLYYITNVKVVDETFYRQIQAELAVA